MKNLIISMCCFAFAGGLMAQDAAAALAAQADAAAKLAVDAAAAAPLLPGVPSGDAKSAEDAVNANLAKLGVGVGYDRKLQAVITIGTVLVSVKDPANDKDFMLVRAAKANEAYLNAKAAIIKAIYTNFSAVDRLTTLSQTGANISTAEYDTKRKELEARRAALADKLAQLDQAEAAALKGVTLGDRFNAVLEGLAKKLDTQFSAEKVAADKRALRDGLKAECEALKAECADLEKQAGELTPPEPENAVESTVKELSKMPLLGSSVLTQAESWDEKTAIYSVSMALVWSPKMQESAVALCTNEAVPALKKGRFTPQEWAARQNFATMIGPRRFTDSEGNNIFVGISAVDLTGPVVKMAAKKKFAEAFARKSVAFSLAGDLESFTEASQNLKEYDDDKRTAVAKIADRVTAQCDLALQGCTQLAVRTVKHPITGRDTYVAAYYVDPLLAKDAGKLRKEAYAGAMRQVEATNKLRAEQRAYEARLKQERENQAKAAAAAAEAKRKLDAEVARQKQLAQAEAARQKREIEARKAELARKQAEAQRQQAEAQARAEALRAERAARLAAIQKERAAEAAAARERYAQLEAIREANAKKFYQSMDGVWADDVDQDALPAF